MLSSNLQLEKWLSLTHVNGIGPAKFWEILKKDPEIKSISTNYKPDWEAVKRDISWLEKNEQAKIILFTDPDYPKLLKQIHNPPPLLYVYGKSDVLNKVQIAIVGSRSASSFGVQQARFFASELSKRGIVITSGLALGVDAAGHRGALSIPRGNSIAVMGCGLDHVYPNCHRKLAAEIVKRGCIVSEFPIGTKPRDYNFPVRNRIISGLSYGVLVIEAKLKSGSLITAEHAFREGREVFAIPGSINDPNVKGCHGLLRNGAKLVESADDVMDELELLLNFVNHVTTASVTQADRGLENLSDSQVATLGAIDIDVTDLDTIVLRTRMPSNQVGSIVFNLELMGYISAVPGGYIKKLG